MKLFKRIVAISLFIIIVSTMMAGCSLNKNVIKIAHKNYTEQRLTGQMMAVYLESKGYETEVMELAGTMLCFDALKNKNVHVYAEYTGTAYGAIFEQSEILGKQETYDYVKAKSEEKYGITWLDNLGWNNTYVLSVTAETAAKYNLASFSDLIAVSKDLELGCDLEFASRADGLPGLVDAYEGLNFKDVKSMDQGLTYQALSNGDIDVNVSYSTDGRIAKFGLVNLIDDRNYFPPYYVAPIIHMDYADEKPEVVAALRELANKWTEEEMCQYNLLVDEGTSAKEVATTMLRDKGLID